MPESEVLLELEAVTIRFGGVVALDDVSMTINKGEILGLIGPNGAGKTTCFNVITGVYPATSGTIRLDGKSLAKRKRYQITKLGIARTFQNIRLFANMTALENVLVGVGARPDEISVNLSYGDQRRLEIARALATNPKLICLDEPAAGFNPAEKQRLMELIRQIRDLGFTVLVVEHDMKLVRGVCDRIVVLEFGRKIAEGTPSEIQKNPAVIAAYLGTEEADDDAA